MGVGMDREREDTGKVKVTTSNPRHTLSRVLVTIVFTKPHCTISCIIML